MLKEFRSKISFRRFGNDAKLANQPLRIAEALFPLDTVNTIINCESPLNTDWYLTVDTPRMSTVAIGYLVNAVVGRMNASHAYLNIGVLEGFTFFAGLAGNPDKRCIGVDNFSQFGGPRDKFQGGYVRYASPNSEFHEMDYVEYLTTKHVEPIGLYYFDGPHEYVDQLRSLELAEPFLAPDALIIVDDTNGEEVRRATLDFMAARPGRYEVLLDEKTYCNCHPTFWNGIMILGPANHEGVSA